MKSRSKTSKANAFVNKMREDSKSIFNTEVFGIYEGIIEAIDNTNGLCNIRIPELNDTLYEECRIMTPASTENIQISTSYKVGTTVIVGFKEFNLGYPIILGQISPVGYKFNEFINDELLIKVGKSTITLTPNTMTFACGSSIIKITESGIEMNGRRILAEGEDLTVDETGDDSSSSNSFDLSEYLESIY